MKKYRTYIVDDEPLALQVIEQYLSKYKEFSVCGKSTDPLQAREALARLKPDLLFLDIEMPEINGLDLIAMLPHEPQVIITTAYREFAVEGFDLNVLDYLVKPIPFQRFAKALDRFLALQNSDKSSMEENDPEYLLLRANRKTVKIPFNEILYIQGVKDYVKIVLENQNILSKSSLGNFYPRLPKDLFLRVHKSYIVSRKKITAFTTQDVELGDREIPIGRAYKAVFLKEMEKKAN